MIRLEARRELEQLLRSANGRRTSRILSVDDLVACAEEARHAPQHFAWRGVGAPDARQASTVCLCVHRDQLLVIGVGVGHGRVTPSSVWFKELGPWTAHDEASKAPQCLAWAGRVRSDRVSVSLEFERSERPAEAELLARILDAPHDDGLRGVYADLLTERGDPRGPFISLSLQSPRSEEVESMLRAHAGLWLGGTPLAQVVFTRGFVAEVSCDAKAIPMELMAREPVTSLRLKTSGPMDAARWLWPWRARLERLSLTSSRNADALGQRSFQQFLALEPLYALQRLELWGQGLGDDGLDALLREGPRVFPALKELHITLEQFESAMPAFWSSRWVSRLEGLSLEAAVGRGGLLPLAGAGPSLRMSWLGLPSNMLKREDVQALATSTRLSALRQLDLSRNWLSAESVLVLLESRRLRGLEHLRLETDRLTPSVRAKYSQRFESSLGDLHARNRRDSLPKPVV